MRKKEEERYELQMHKNHHYQTSINAPASHHFRRQGNYTGELSIEPDQRSEDSEENEIFEDK